ncbi:MAG: ABC transporter substrate-binding protein [Planctomycetota bacterium]|nr:ABC transporter substrate-binding protein [Planctomycetota bacterium]
MRLLLSILLCTLAACSGPEEVREQTGPTREIELKDGTTVTVPERAVRILAATSGTMDLLAKLCEPERLVAIPAPARYWSIIAEDPEPWADHPLLHRFNSEAVLAFDPDLVLVSSWSAAAAIDTAGKYGIPVVTIPDSHSWERLVEGVELVGAAIGELERAAAFLAEIEARRAKLAERDRSQWSVLTYSNFGQGGMTSGSGTTLHLAIELAGMRNAAAESGLKQHPQISLEEVLIFDPDLFLTASGRDGVEAGASFLRGESALAPLDAIKQDHIAVISPELFSSSSHRVLDTAEELARIADEMLAGE